MKTSESMSYNSTTVSSNSVPTVRDVMSKNLVTLYVDDTFKTLKDLMEWKRIRHIPVVRENGELVGLVTQRDFLNLAVSKLAKIEKSELDDLYSHIKIEDIMGKKVTSVDPDTTLSTAAAMMIQHKFGCLPVVEEGKLVGIITEADFVKTYINH